MTPSSTRTSRLMRSRGTADCSPRVAVRPGDRAKVARVAVVIENDLLIQLTQVPSYRRQPISHDPIELRPERPRLPCGQEFRQRIRRSSRRRAWSSLIPRLRI